MHESLAKMELLNAEISAKTPPPCCLPPPPPVSALHRWNCIRFLPTANSWWVHLRFAITHDWREGEFLALQTGIPHAWQSSLNESLRPDPRERKVWKDPLQLQGGRRRKDRRGIGNSQKTISMSAISFLASPRHGETFALPIRSQCNKMIWTSIRDSARIYISHNDVQWNSGKKKTKTQGISNSRDFSPSKYETNKAKPNEWLHFWGSISLWPTSSEIISNFLAFLWTTAMLLFFVSIAAEAVFRLNSKVKRCCCCSICHSGPKTDTVKTLHYPDSPKSKARKTNSSLATPAL